jgi:hypothetical protein
MPRTPCAFLRFKHQRVILDRVPPTQKRANKAERSIQTFRNHFLSILVGTHPNFPINQWHHLLPQEATLNMLHAWPDNMAISAYHGLHRGPYDFLSHPSMAPCGTLLVAHTTTPAALSGTITGASVSISVPPSPTITALIIASSPTPTSRASATASCSTRPPSFSRVHLGLTSSSSSPNAWSPPRSLTLPRPTTNLYTPNAYKSSRNSFSFADAPNAPERPPLHNAVPPTASTRHRPSTDIGIDLVGYSFKDRALGQCKVVGPSTYTDEDNIVWNALEFTSTTYPIDLQFSKVSEVQAWIAKDKNHRPPAPVPTPVRLAPQRLTQGPIPEPPQRAILQAPNSVPPQPIHRYDLRSRRDALSAKRIRRNHRDHRRAYAAVLPIPEAYIPPALKLDVNGWQTAHILISKKRPASCGNVQKQMSSFASSTLRLSFPSSIVTFRKTALATSSIIIRS